MRKEFLIFGGVVVLLIVAIVATPLLKREHYESGDVMINFESEADPEAPYTPQTPVRDDFQVGEEFPARQENTQQVSGTSTQPTTAPDETTPPDESGSEGEEGVVSEPPDDEIQGEPEDGQGDGAGVIVDSEQLAYMLAYYVCGIEHDLYSSYLSPALLSEFGTRIDAPYDTLRSNTYFEDLLFSDGILSFVDKNGTRYMFDVTLDGQTVTSIESIA